MTQDQHPDSRPASAVASARHAFKSFYETDPEVTGAPRPMKMGNILSPWHYDAAIRHALQLAKLRRASIQHCVFWISYRGVVRLLLKKQPSQAVS